MTWVTREMERPDERRYRVFTLSMSAFAGLFRAMDGNRVLRIEDWPDDARIIGVDYRVEMDGWAIAVWSSAYDIVPDNCTASYDCLTISERYLNVPELTEVT